MKDFSWDIEFFIDDPDSQIWYAEALLEILGTKCLNEGYLLEFLCTGCSD